MQSYNDEIRKIGDMLSSKTLEETSLEFINNFIYILYNLFIIKMQGIYTMSSYIKAFKSIFGKELLSIVCDKNLENYNYIFSDLLFGDYVFDEDVKNVFKYMLEYILYEIIMRGVIYTFEDNTVSVHVHHLKKAIIQDVTFNYFVIKNNIVIFDEKTSVASVPIHHWKKLLESIDSDMKFSDNSIILMQKYIEYKLNLCLR